MIKGLKYAFFLALVLTSYLGISQSIFANPITGAVPSNANPYTAGQTHDSQITASGIRRGTGISWVNTTGSFTAAGWTLLGLDSNDYFEFTLIPNPGYKIDFSSFNFTAESTLLTGPNSMSVRTSLDNFASSIAGSLTTLTLGSPTPYSINLSASAYQNITTPITFRIYGFLALGGTLSIHDFVFNGIVSCANTTTWSGSAWSNGLPTLSTHAIIAGNYNTSTGGSQTSFRACSLTVNAGSTLNIGNKTYVEVENNIVANGNITIQTQGNLKQNNDASTVSGIGTTSVNKQTPVKNNWYHYTYWSSPVRGQTIEDAFPATDSNRRFWFDAANYLDSNGDNVDDNGNDWVIAPGTSVMIPGVGYIATSGRLGPYPSTDMATFTGPFNTGPISTAIVYKPENINLYSWNLIGNPYPSAIDFNEFYAANSSVIAGAAYLWSQYSPPLSSNPGNQALNFNQDDYTVYNVGSGESVASLSGMSATQYIPSGQSFFVSGLSNGNVTFTNAMRMADETSNNQFFKNSDSKNNLEKNKLWINLTSDNGVFNQILAAYVDGATDGDDGLTYDAPRMVTPQTSIALYSIIGNSNKKFAIQCKAENSLTSNDTIRLGLKTSINVPTQYTLSIAKLKGDFLTQNTIYLRDNLLDITHNLSEADYTFTSEVGEYNDRFAVVFNNGQFPVEDDLLTNDDALNIIYLDDDRIKFTVSNNLKIKNVFIFDLLGRYLYKFAGENSEEIYSLPNLKNSIYISKVELSNGTIVTKKTVKY
jgi:hypothetical protein